MERKKYKIFLWGTGYVAEVVFSWCQTINLYEILGFIDNNPEKENQFFQNIKIYSPSVLERIVPDKIVILTEAYEEVYEQIKNMHPEMEFLIENQYFFYKESILKRYSKEKDVEITQVLEYINKNGLGIFNYKFAEKYRHLDVHICLDAQNDLFYVMHNGKRMYFPRKWRDKDQIAAYYRGILMEQDIDSPHRYLTKDFQINQGDVVVDIGTAEGNFSLEIVDRVSKLYIIETDEEWMEALRETFKEYSEKIEIIQKYVTDYEEGEYVALDHLIQEPVNFIKMDIEGNEWEALCGAKEVIKKSKRLKCAICSYHRDVDEILIKDFFRENGMTFKTTPGFMWYPGMARQSYISTKLNRGIVRGIKSEGERI